MLRLSQCALVSRNVEPVIGKLNTYVTRIGSCDIGEFLIKVQESERGMMKRVRKIGSNE